VTVGWLIAIDKAKYFLDIAAYFPNICLVLVEKTQKPNPHDRQEISSMSPIIRQGDVLIIPSDTLVKGTKLPHLTLAEGEVTGHRHRISNGEAELLERDGVLYLRVLSPTAILTHEEHAQVTIPQGNWEIRIQREYEPEGWRYVAD
jgi:hypothetical protein